MRERLFSAAVLAVLCGLGSSGCQHCRNQCCYPPYLPVGECGVACTPQCPNGVLPPHPLTPMQSAPVAVSPAGPPPAPPATQAQPGVPSPPLPVPPPPDAPQQPALQRPSFAPPSSDWQPVAPGNATPEPPRESVRLYPPATPPPPIATEDRKEPPAPEPGKPAVSEPSKPAVSEERKPAGSTPALPVGIPQFAPAQEGVTAGLRPSLDGLNWLKDNGYRTVLHVRAPGQDDSSDRDQFKLRGINYLSLEVSPETLGKKTVDEFNRIVGDRANYPLFVYDRDGMLAGGLWYLHLRTAGHESDSTARERAARLGLKEDQNGDQRTMWLAIQKFLGDQGIK